MLLMRLPSTCFSVHLPLPDPPGFLTYHGDCLGQATAGSATPYLKASSPRPDTLSSTST